MITLDKTTLPLKTIILPADLFWVDEFGWTPVTSSLEYGTTGSAFVDVSKKLAGRPITLEAEGELYCWVTRNTFLDLQALSDIPGEEMKLTIYGTEYTVIFAPGEKPFDGEPIWREMPVESTDKYQLTAIRFITV